MRLEISDEAERDLRIGARFYESQSSGLGGYFLDSLSADIESLRIYAGVHQKHYGYFRMLSRRFPYAVYYLVEEDLVRIRAVLDTRRDPSTIHREIEER